MLRTATLVFFTCLALAPMRAMAATTGGDVTAGLLAALYSESDVVATPQDRDLRDVYGSRNFAPLWWRDGGWTAQARDAMAILAVSKRHGIDGIRYGIDPLQRFMAIDPERLDGGMAAVGDMALTSAVLAYLHDQSAGRTDPASTGWYSRTNRGGDAVALLKQGLDAPDFAAWLNGQAPLYGGYAALTGEMERLDRLAGLPWTDLERAGLVRPGGTDDRIPEIRQRLMLLGDYQVIRPNQRADQAAATDSTSYDAILVAAVERFQRRHGLEDDGVIGPKTVAALNVSPAALSRTIAVNLERLRWLPDPAGFAGRHIVVNVAGFELTAYLDGAPALSMPVIVGQPGHKTPLLGDQIVNVKFAPTWTVPDRIARRELLPKIKNDPSYLASNNFRVFLDHAATVEIDPAQVDWAALSSSNMPYMLRQDPGPSNALGLIRFSLSNDLNIYMHDTGSRQLFAQAERSLSHGCVRVGSPVELADFVLDGLDKAWTPNDIELAMGADKPHFQKLAAPVPVDLVYFTAWVDAAGKVQFRDDIYGYDGALVSQLEISDRSGPQAVTRLIDALAALDESPTVTAALNQDQI
jgi:L,D-transpeptidase YcbB